jgi:hypothetical protein
MPSERGIIQLDEIPERPKFIDLNLVDPIAEFLDISDDEVCCTTEDDVAEHVRHIVDDVTAGRVAPKQIAEIEEAIHRHQVDRAVHRAIRSG